MTKILITDGMAVDGQEILKSEKSFSLDVRKETPANELLSMIGGYECLVVRSATKVTKEVLENAKNLKLVCRAGAGVDNVDVATATSLGIKVMNTASANSLAAAELTIALLFSMFRQIPTAHQSLRESRWDRAAFTGIETTGKTMGILGLGNIGRLVAERAVGLRMKVIGYDPFVKMLPVDLEGSVKLEKSVEDVLKACDVLTIHLPFTKETKGILSKEKLSLMKKGSYLINCARGGLIDENAVCDLLDSGHLSGAAFDVYETEPVKFPNRLVSHPKAVVTPHLGASTAEAQLRVGLTAAQQITGFFKNQDQTGVLN